MQGDAGGVRAEITETTNPNTVGMAKANQKQGCVKGISLRQFKKESLSNPFCSYSSSYCSTPNSIISYHIIYHIISLVSASIADFTSSNQKFKGMLSIKHIKTGVKHILMGYINMRPQLLYTELLNNILESHAHTADQR